MLGKSRYKQYGLMRFYCKAKPPAASANLANPAPISSIKIDHPKVQARLPSIKLFTGSTHPDLANKIVEELGIPLGKATASKFSNKETSIKIRESVRGQSVFILQTAGDEINDSIIELCIMIHACKISSASRITAVIPCFPYARHNKRVKTRTAITAKLVANMLSVAGANHVVTMDLHASQIQGFFDMPCDNLYAEKALKLWIQANIPEWKTSVLVAPNATGVKQITSMADTLGVAFAIVHYDKDDSSSSVLVGDVKDKTTIIVNDVVYTGNTIVNAATKLRDGGAKRVCALVTHGVLSGSAIEKINQSCLEFLVVTNTTPQNQHSKLCPKLKVIDISKILAKAMERVYHADCASITYRPIQKF